MIQQEQDENNFTAHEIALQLKETMQTTLQDMGVEVISKDEGPSKDLLQVTADDFDNFDHYNSPNNKAQAKANKKQQDQLNKQRLSQISRIEQKLTDRINTLLSSNHISDTDAGEMEDAYTEAKPIIKLENRLSQITSKIKDVEVQKAKTESFSQLDKAFEGLKNLVDGRKQHLAQLNVARKHQVSEFEDEDRQQDGKQQHLA